MRRNRLNVRALRSRRLPLASSEARHADLWLSAESPTLSRRKALGLTGLAALGTSPVLKALDGALLGPFTVNASEERLAFRLGGKDRWVIDTRRLGPGARLKFKRTDRSMRVLLRGARYPGTDLPADFVCLLERGVVGWRMKLRLALGDFSSETSFERWLVGEAPARGGLRLDQPLGQLGTAGEIRLAGRGQAEFFPDWSLRLQGSEIVRLKWGDAEIVSDRVEISPRAGRTSSLMDRPPASRTLISLERGNHTWRLEPYPAATGVGRLVAEGDSFDVLKIEMGQTLTGARRVALAAESQSEESGLHYEPSGGLTDHGGQPARLPLRKPLYAAAFDPGGNHTALLARFAREAVWLRTDACGFEVSDCEEASPFELVCRGDRIAGFRCAPALRRVWAPLPGAIVQPTVAPEGARLALVASAAPMAPAVQAAPFQIELGTQAGIASVSTLVVPVLRPEDLLSIAFQFTNLRLETRPLKASLVRMQPSQPAYISVGFPPQNIAEQAFFETAEGYPIPKTPPPPTPPSKQPKDPDADKGSSEDLQEPPVQSRLSGPSRLVFTVPNSVQEIPYTLDDLLKACSQYEASLAATALPPTLPNLPSESFQSCAAPRLKAVPPSERVHPRSRVEMRAPELRAPRGLQPATPVVPLAQQSKQKIGKQAVKPGLAVGSLAQFLTIQPAAPNETAIECPYRLMISPNRFGGWAHARKPVQGGETKRIELWHTRLGVRCRDKDGNLIVDEARFRELRTLRAIWSPDYPENQRQKENHPFRMSLTGKDRYQIVELTANYGLKTDQGPPYDPDPVDVERLMLSALGAWMDTRGAWDPPGDLSVEEWRHLATMGRDHFVRVVYRGYLYPFGHRASLVKITERKFQRTPKTRRMAAYLRQRMFIIVREPEKSYPAFGQEHDGRKIPFLSLRTTTLITPNLDIPDGIAGTESTDAFWPKVGGTEFLFHFVATDVAGHQSEFTAPVIFVGKTIAFGPWPPMPPVPGSPRSWPNPDLGEISANYLAASDNRQRDMSGQKITFAESSKPGDTAFETDGLLLGSQMPRVEITRDDLLKQGQPPFYPTVEEAQIRVAAVEQITGSAAGTRIRFHDSYLNSGFAASQNKGQVFAELLEKVQLGFGGNGVSTDKAGGFVTPNMLIGGLSRSLGPVGGALDKIVSGEFNPEEFFKGALSDAKILGAIKLWDILQTITDFSGQLDRVLKFIPTRLPDALETTFSWKPFVQDFPNSATPLLKFTNLDKNPTPFSIDGKLRTPLNGQSPTSEIKAELKEFEVHLIPSVLEVVILKFNSLSFEMKNGLKPDVSVNFDDFAFAGPLEFINTLRHYLPLDGFKDPPDLDVTAEGVKLSYTLGVPAVTLGVMSLQNINLSAEFRLPFFGDPINFRFAFSEQHNPFLLTVWVFGGGGFFALELEPQEEGLKKLEASFEFGGNFALNLGVASGGVHLMAGIYYSKTGQKTELAGYLRCGGSVRVLGIITISVEFYMELHHESPPSRMYGRATLTVEIEILFFSISVDLTVEREFAGSEQAALYPEVAGPVPPLPLPAALTVEEMMTADDWAEYCEAFA